MKKIFKMAIFLSFIFLFHHLSKGDVFPIEFNCEKEEQCTCARAEKSDIFNVQLLLDFIKSEKNIDKRLLACYYHQIAVEFHRDRNFIDAIQYNNSAKKIREVNKDGLLWKSQLNLGLCYFRLQDYRQSTVYLEKSLRTLGLKKTKDSINIVRNLADSYYRLGDLEKALEFGKNALQIKAKSKQRGKAYCVVANILNEKKDSMNLEKAIVYADKAIKLSTEAQNFGNIANSLISKGNSFRELKKYNKAIAQYQIIVNNADVWNINKIKKAKVINNIATTLFVQKEYNLAIQKLKQSLNLKQEEEAQFSYHYASNFENLADIYTALQQFDTALLHYQKALINLTNNFRNKDILKNPNPKDTSLFIYSNPDMIRVLHLKATAAFKYYQQNEEEKYLTLANQTYQTVFDFHDKLQKDISTENSRLFQAKNIVSYIENALEVVYQQQQNGQDISKAAFRFMEKNKATVLLQSMNDADALQFANLPDSLLKQEKELKIALTFHLKQLNNATEDENTSEIKRLDEIIFSEKQQYNQLIVNLEKNYPKYYQLKYQQNQTQLADVQNKLNTKTMLIEYFVGDSTIYILSIQKNQSKLYQLTKPTNWNEVIDSFRLALTDTETILAGANIHQKEFVQYGHLLYEWLLQQPFEDMDNQIERLQIIPDAELNYIPFELLLTETVDNGTINYKQLPYLLRQQSIGYVYSAAFLLDKKIVAIDTLLSLAGFAADYQNSNFLALPFAEKSVLNVTKKVSGTPFLKATKTTFMEEAKKYKLLFFATHAELDDKNPMNSSLVFSETNDSIDFKLRAADLYNTTLNAEMALLSACETGVGKIHQGEGVMSLARAFTYAGCPSLIMSLWRIPDASTTKITDTFFEYLQTDLTKDKALQKAKLAYLDNASEIKSHPVYWAGLVATGDLSPVNFNYLVSASAFWLIALLCISAFSITTFLYLYNR